MTVEQQQKIQLFAQYWGQKILLYKFDESLHWINSSKDFESNVWSLFLTPLSMITDEDAKEGVEILGEKPIILDDLLGIAPTGINAFKQFCDRIQVNNYIGANRYEAHRLISAIDFLRSSGYALPYLGISVEEQVQRGWVKLKS